MGRTAPAREPARVFRRDAAVLDPRFALALLAGTLACLWLPATPAPWALLCLATAAALLRWPAPRAPLWVAVCCAGFVLAGLRADRALSRQWPSSPVAAGVALRGTVVDLPSHEPRRTRFTLVVDDAADQSPALRGRRLRLSWYDGFGVPPDRSDAADAPRRQVAAGSRWAFAAKIRAPRGLRNPGAGDAEKHMLIDRIVATGHVRDEASATRLAPPRGIDAWRERLSARIAAAVPGAGARFVQALALGDTRGLDDADWTRLRAAGLTHLIAISGFHVGLVAGAAALALRGLWWLWPALGRRLGGRLVRPQAALLAATAGALGYAALAGFALPTVRTVLMIAVVAAARSLRRAQRPADTLALATIAVLLFDPLSALSAGFWLSFGGVAWLLWCLPRGEGRPLREFFAAQGVATLGLLPLGVALFGQASFAAPLANPLAIPWWSLVVVPLSLLGTALDAVHAGWGVPLWRAAAACFDPSWRFFGWLTDGPLSLWWLPEPAWFAAPLALLAAFWMLLPRGVPGRALALLLWLPLLWPDRRLPRAGEAEVVVLDVGQGLSVLVRTRGHALLFDMGPAQPDGFDAGERAVSPALHALGVPALDAAVVSHGDNDHAGGFGAVAAEFAVDRRFAPPDSGLDAKIDRLRDCRAGEGWTWDGVRFRFLHPPRYFPYLRNESSCVLRIETAHGAALLTGDIGQVIERDLLRLDADAVRAEVVVVAHHGSASSSDPGFVAATGARFAALSAGDGNRFRHPRPAVVALWRRHGARAPLTADGGALRFRLAADGVSLATERGRHPRLWDAAALRRQPRGGGSAAGLSYGRDALPER